MNISAEFEVIIKTSEGYLRFIGINGKVTPLKALLDDSPDAVDNAVMLATRDIAIFIESDDNTTRLYPCVNDPKYDKDVVLPVALESFIKSVNKITEIQCGSIYYAGRFRRIIFWDISNVKCRLYILPATGLISGSAWLTNENNTLIGIYTVADGFIKKPHNKIP